MAQPAASARQEKGWLGPVMALLLMSAVPLAPPLRVLFPIEHVILLLAPLLAACSLVAWGAGGRFYLVLIWVGLSTWTLWPPVKSITPYFDRLERGWALLLAAAFGIVCLVLPARPFFTRALVAIATALVLGVAVLLVAGGSTQDVTQAVLGEFQQRNSESISAYQRQVANAPWFSEFAGDFMKEAPKQLENLAVGSIRVFPALLALESLATLALAWALFHRLSRARVGEPLTKLGDFRFDDQMVWGLLAGLTLVVIPSLGDLQALGWMLVIFFAGLYVVRGLGVAAWALQARKRWQQILTIVLMLALPHFAVAALLGLGVGDTWADWRRRPGPAA